MANKTVTVRPSGGTYTSLAAAIAGEVAANANLVTMAGILTISIEGDWSGGADTTSVNVTGFTTNSSYYVNIVADSSNSAGTSYSASKYRLEVSSAATAILIATSNYTRIKGLQVKNTNTSGAMCVSMAGTAGGVLDSCYVTCADTGANCRIIRVESGATNVVVVNTIAICLSGGLVGIRSYVASCVIYNCVGVTNNASSFGIYCSGTEAVKNCYAKARDGAASAYTSGTLTKCASSDATGSTGLQSIAFSTSNFTNVTGGSENLSLPSGSGLVAVGTDLRSDAAWNVTVDILGTTRAATPCVGAYEYVSAGGISIPVVMHHLRMQGAL